MTEESKKTLYILTNAGGWADDVEEENDVQESKSKAWDKIDKPDVVPIGSSDFEIKGTKDQGQQEQEQRRYQNDGQRNNRNHNNQRFRNENGKPTFFNKDRKGGNRDRRQNGRSNDEGSRWERKPNNNGKGFDETRTRKPLVLAPRSVSQTDDSSSSTENKESPFGLATPKVTGKEHLETTETTTSTVSEQAEPTPSNEEERERKPRMNGSRNFGSSSNSSPFGKRKNNNQNKRFNNEKKMTPDGFQIQSRNRNNRSDYKRNRNNDYKRNDSERVTEVTKQTSDVNTHNTFSILSED